MSQRALPLPMDAIREFCRKWKVARLEVFGSILRADFGPESDVDFLVTWQEGVSWTFAQRLDAKEELQALLARPVDLVERELIENSRNWIRRENILGSAETIHAA